MKQILVEKCFFLQHLKGIKLSLRAFYPLSYQIDFGIGTSADNFNYVKFVKLNFLRVEALYDFQVFFIIRLITTTIVLDLLD